MEFALALVGLMMWGIYRTIVGSAKLVERERIIAKEKEKGIVYKNWDAGLEGDGTFSILGGGVIVLFGTMVIFQNEWISLLSTLAYFILRCRELTKVTITEEGKEYTVRDRYYVGDENRDVEKEFEKAIYKNPGVASILTTVERSQGIEERQKLEEHLKARLRKPTNKNEAIRAEMLEKIERCEAAKRAKEEAKRTKVVKAEKENVVKIKAENDELTGVVAENLKELIATKGEGNKVVEIETDEGLKLQMTVVKKSNNQSIKDEKG